jgi:simple sugar transport system ATP-binding protein
MVGRDVAFRVPKPPGRPGAVRLAVQDLWVQDDRGLPALRGVSLAVRAGEIVGVAGVEGNGQRELEEALGGLRPAQAGQIRLDGRDVTGGSPRQRLQAGLGYVPSDRYQTALLPDFSVADNLVLQTIGQRPYARRGWLRAGAIRAHAAACLRAFDIRAASERVPVGTLSGGNAQKVVMARELARQPRLLLAAQPTRGLDVGAMEFVHRELVRQRDQGLAVLLISTELEEILSLSDRILVLYEGQVVGERPGARAEAHELGLMMAGAGAGARPPGAA